MCKAETGIPHPVPSSCPANPDGDETDDDERDECDVNRRYEVSRYQPQRCGR